MEALALYTCVPTVNWEDNTSCISVVEAKRVTPRVKHIDIYVFFLQEQFENGLFLMPEDMCTKPCSGPIISRSTNSMTRFRFYPTSETEHYQFIRLHEFIENSRVNLNKAGASSMERKCHRRYYINILVSGYSSIN